jgi:hypothetical protein
VTDISPQQTVSYGERAASYWSVDGLPEILRGLALIILGGFSSLFLAPGPFTRLGMLAVLGVTYGYFFLVERVILDALKSRLTYPRTGYVQPPDPAWSLREPPVPLTLGLNEPYVLSSFPPPASENASSFWPRTVRPLMAFVLLCWVGGSLLGRWLIPLAMPALAVTLYIANRRSERPYSRRSALILALTGLVFIWVEVAAPLQRSLPWLLAGGWLVGQGVYTLVDFLRENPRPGAAGGAAA